MERITIYNQAAGQNETLDPSRITSSQKNVDGDNHHISTTFHLDNKAEVKGKESSSGSFVTVDPETAKRINEARGVSDEEAKA
jgi:hypothetical protein